MKRTGVILALALGLMAQSAVAKTINVVTSFSILGDITRQVGGDHVKVTSLVGPDGDPHTFDLRQKIARCLIMRMWWWSTGLGWKVGSTG